MEQKKKSSNYIIPATFFTALSPAKKKVQPTVVKTPPATPPPPVSKPEVATPPKPRLEGVRRRSASLTLKSIHEKKEEKEIDIEENFDNHPKDHFTEAQLQEAWNKYYFKLYNGGERSVASILTASEPKLGTNFEILFSLPNKLMAEQLDRAKPKLLKFLRESFNNYGLSIKLTVNEAVERKLVYTNQDKYEKLREKNPLIQQLKNTFGLDV